MFYSANNRTASRRWHCSGKYNWGVRGPVWRMTYVLPDKGHRINLVTSTTNYLPRDQSRNYYAQTHLGQCCLLPVKCRAACDYTEHSVTLLTLRLRVVQKHKLGLLQYYNEHGGNNGSDTWKRYCSQYTGPPQRATISQITIEWKKQRLFLLCTAKIQSYTNLLGRMVYKGSKWSIPLHLILIVNTQIAPWWAVLA